MAAKDTAHPDDTALFEALAAAAEAQDPTYIKARTLQLGAEQTAPKVAGLIADELQAGLPGAQVSGFLHRVLAQKADRRIALLVGAALLALRHRERAAAEELAREVIARDHHDLLSQRIVDAALEEAASLETETDRWLQGRTCEAPFREIETRANGMVHFCCSAWQPAPIGAIDDTSETGFWNSERAREIRRSVIEGDFSHCSRWHCPKIAGRTLPKRRTPPPDRISATGPKRVILSHDRSCNISCPSCRSDLIAMKRKDSDRLNDLFETSILPLVRDADVFKVTGSGDPFGSRHFRHILKSICSEGPPKRRIQLHTNGLLADRRAWDGLGLWGNVTSIWVSIDAARADTYAVLRRGGSFETLLPNLRFMGELLRSGEIDSFRLDFVVQQRNYREIAAFTDLAEEVGADGVYFLRLRNWGLFSAGEFREMDVCSPDHPEYDALLHELRDARLQRPGVSLGSMAPLMQTARAAQAT